MANYENYVIKGKTLDGITKKIKTISGVDTSTPMSLDEITDNITQANADVEAQTDIIARIKTALDGKVSGSGSGGGESLPDWDDDSPIIASGRSYYTNNITWELTEKGTFRWKIIDTDKSGEVNFRAGVGGSSLGAVSLDYLAIALKIRQMCAEDGIKNLDFAYAVNCERIMFPNTLIETPGLSVLPSVKEADFSGDLFSTLASYQCNQWFKLEKVALSPLLTTIPVRAFAQCYSLEDINIENVTIFKNSCFMEDFSLNSNIVFSESLTSIEATAFQRTRIKSVKYRNSTDNLPTIANSAFSQCRELKAIFCPWSEGAVDNANGGAPNATIYYNVTYDANDNPIDENGNPIIVEV